ncbi:hypothetical protein [Mucilaginibacter corticis]|uniref:hypothetical protein n=1 Tax=Mucilaginibacter corticis TaxID=2597670 RepID=UPI00164257AE|nr:hypothetical protein [Mucilaginibacter corticis]
MADINVQPKKSSPWWLWLLIAVIAVAILYFIFHGHSGQGTQNNADTTTSGQHNN